MRNYLHYFLLIGIFALAFFLRFYQLGNVPHGFYQDESAIGYNAYSILTTGKDEYGKSFPLYFKSFGDYKLPVYIYATIPSIMLFGMTEFAVRFPSALFGFLTVIMTYFFVKELTKQKVLAIVTTFLLAINPWSLHYNRATFEVSICLFLFVAGSWLYIKAFRERWRGAFLLATICFVISLYTYNLTRLLSPVLLLTMLFYEVRVEKKSFPKIESIVSAIVAIILMLPFALSFFGQGGVSSASGTLFFSSAAVQAPLLEFREYISQASPLLGKILFNKFALDLWQYVVNVFSYFSISFFFISGSSHGNHGIGNVGEFYVFELPLIVWGLIHLFHSKRKWLVFLLGWGILTILIASLTRDIPQATRSFFLVVPVEIISAVGLIECGKFIWSQKSTLRCGLGIVAVLSAIFFISFYFVSYYLRFPILYAKDWRLEDKTLSLYIENHQQEYTHIIFDKNAGFVYTSLLFYAKYPPKDFQQTVKRAPDDTEGFSQVLSFGKYEFKDVDFSKDYQKGTLIITTTERKPEDLPPLASFAYPVRPVAFAVGQEIISYPVQDYAYVVLTKK